MASQLRAAQHLLHCEKVETQALSQQVHTSLLQTGAHVASPHVSGDLQLHVQKLAHEASPQALEETPWRKQRVADLGNATPMTAAALYCCAHICWVLTILFTYLVETSKGSRTLSFGCFKFVFPVYIS